MKLSPNPPPAFYINIGFNQHRTLSRPEPPYTAVSTRRASVSSLWDGGYHGVETQYNASAPRHGSFSSINISRSCSFTTTVYYYIKKKERKKRKKEKKERKRLSSLHRTYMDTRPHTYALRFLFAPLLLQYYSPLLSTISSSLHANNRT